MVLGHGPRRVGSESVQHAVQTGFRRHTVPAISAFLGGHCTLAHHAVADGKRSHTSTHLDNALREADVKLASMLVTFRWASPHEDEREAAVRYWKRAIEIAVELECETVNSIFDRGPSPERCNFKVGPEMAEDCETAFWKSMEELVPTFEKEKLPCRIANERFWLVLLQSMREKRSTAPQMLALMG